jgi:hypothetical protein
MLRVGLAAAFATVLGISLTGCSSLLSSNSSSEQLQALNFAALSSNSSSEQLQALNFESDPPGAEIRTTQGQTCITPCELTVQSHEQPVTITKNDYVPQTVQVTTGPQPDHSFWQNPPPTLVPNPVRVVLQPVPKPVHHAGGKPLHHAGGHRSVSRTHTAKTVPTPSAASSPFKPPPPTQGPAASSFPPSPLLRVLPN